MQILVAALIAVLVFLQYLLWIAEDGVRQTYALRVAIQAQTEENAELNERNRALEADVKDLKSGLMAIEERARSEMGMIAFSNNHRNRLSRPNHLSRLPNHPPNLSSRRPQPLNRRWPNRPNHPPNPSSRRPRPPSRRQSNPPNHLPRPLNRRRPNRSSHRPRPLNRRRPNPSSHRPRPLNRRWPNPSSHRPNPSSYRPRPPNRRPLHPLHCARLVRRPTARSRVER